MDLKKTLAGGWLALIGVLGILVFWHAAQAAVLTTAPFPTTEGEVFVDGKPYKVQTTLVPLSGGNVVGLVTAPSYLSVYTSNKDTITLVWCDNSQNESQFAIWRRDDGATEWKQVGIVLPNKTVYTDKGLTPNAFYEYRVRASNTQTGSDYSNTVKAGTQWFPVPPNTDPYITAVVDATGQQVTVAAVGQEVTIIGENFGTGGQVSYNQQNVPVTAWSSTAIKVKLTGFTNQVNPGALLVWRNDGKYYVALSFRIGLP